MSEPAYMRRPEHRRPGTSFSMLVFLVIALAMLAVFDALVPKSSPISRLSLASLAFQIITVSLLWRIHCTQWGGTELERENDAKEESQRPQ